MWYKIAAKNKYYMAFILAQRNMQGSSLRVKWALVYIRTYFIVPESLLSKLSFDVAIMHSL